MIINNKSTQGVFIYAETAEYEKGDFIVDEDSIYICTPKEGDTVLGKKPKNDPENYKIYLGGNVATWEDFEEQFTNQSDIVSDDKLITSMILSQILKKLSFGLDSNGIITESTKPLSPNLKNLLSSTGLSSTNQQDIIDHLLLTENVTEYNNMTVRVDRSLFKDILPSIENLTTEGSLDDIELRSVILKQYTYYESLSYTSKNPNNKIRIQEVIDHFNGVCLYRFARFGEEIAVAGISEGKIGIPSSWKLSCPNLQYLSKLNALLKYIENTKSNKTSNFTFKDITDLLKGPEVELEKQRCSYTLQLGDNLKNEELSLTTVVISVIKNDIHYNYSLTINLSDPKSSTTYAFPNEVRIARKNNTINLSWENLNIDSVSISNIYVKSYEN